MLRYVGHQGQSTTTLNLKHHPKANQTDQRLVGQVGLGRAGVKGRSDVLISGERLSWWTEHKQKEERRWRRRLGLQMLMLHVGIRLMAWSQQQVNNLIMTYLSPSSIGYRPTNQTMLARELLYIFNMYVSIRSCTWLTVRVDSVDPRLDLLFLQSWVNEECDGMSALVNPEELDLSW